MYHNFCIFNVYINFVVNLIFYLIVDLILMCQMRTNEPVHMYVKTIDVYTRSSAVAVIADCTAYCL